MSFDPNANNPMAEKSPMGNFEEPKPKKKWWMIAGFGCVGFLVICCGGGGLLFYFTLGKPMAEMQGMIRESQEFARTSQVVADAVGEPVAVADQPNELIPKTYVEDGVNMQEIRFAVTGSDAKGDLVLKIAMPSQLKFERDSLTLELEDGTVVDLDPEEEFDLDIDTGDSE